MHIVHGPQCGLSAAIPVYLAEPRPRALIVTKRVYRLMPTGGLLPLTPDEEAFALPLGDMPDPAAPSCLRYASDFAPYKPFTDLLLVGSAYLDAPAPAARIALTVGPWRKEAAVVGERYWTGSRDTPKATDPQPFTVMPIGWDRAVGGPEDARNPAGRGQTPLALPDGRQMLPLPNVENPKDPVRRIGDRPQPVGFGPLPSSWAPRKPLSGTWDDRWLKTRWPGLPDDFDWSHYCAAPPDQRLATPLTGDEAIRLDNLMPQSPVYETALPGVRPRAFLLRDDARGRAFFEVPLRLDTLWLDSDAQLMALVWRGTAEAEAPELSEFTHLYVADEALAAPPAPAEAHYAAFKTETQVTALEAEPDAPPPPDDPPGDAPEDEGAVLADLTKALDEAKAAMAKGGVPDTVLAKLQPGQDPTAFLNALLAHLKIDPAQADQAKALIKTQQRAKLKAMGFDETLLDELDATQAADAAGEAPDAPPLADKRAQILAAHAEGRSLADEDFTGTDLSGLALAGLQAPGALFEGADLSGTDLTGAQLSEAQFSGAVLSGAQLSEADLRQADFTAARLTGARLADAQAEGADFARATLTGADLRGIAAPRSDWSDADLSDARIDRGDFTEASLGRARLDRASAPAACLRSALLAAAQADGADFTGADLTELQAIEGALLIRCRFREVQAQGSLWHDSRLSGSDFTLAALKRADFTGATVDQVSFYGADAADAVFDRAVLAHSGLVGANLMQASLIAADLQAADLRQANLYRAELWRARLDGADLTGARVAGTKTALGLVGQNAKA